MDSDRDSSVNLGTEDSVILKHTASELCRLCANTDNQLIPIFKGDGLEHDIPRKLKKHLPIIKISEFDKLPLQICYQCASTLLAWHDLYEGCSLADGRLRSILAVEENDLKDEVEMDFDDDFRSDDLGESGKSCVDDVNILQPITSITEADKLLDLNNIECNDTQSSSDITVVTERENNNIDRSKNKIPFEDNCLYSCASCSKIFKSRNGIVKHLKRAHKTSDNISSATASAWLNRCTLCNKKYSSREAFQRHIARQHTTSNTPIKAHDDFFKKAQVSINNERWFRCDQCSYITCLKIRLREHYRKHTGERPFTCDKCGKQFRVKKFLINHLRFVHEGIKEHPCPVCGRCFSEKRFAEDHRRTHTGERPYVCEVCGHTFTQAASLFVHKRVHGDRVEYKCSMCPKTFKYKSSLKVHVDQHNKVSRHRCSTCDRRFVRLSSLKTHEVVHSERRPFVCTLCNATFKLKKYLQRHNRTHFVS